MHCALVISPHADDAAAFCGGTLAKLASEGWRVVLVRVTDDAKDSVGLTIEETVRRNRQELRQAAQILGVHEIVELDFPTDCLADVAEVTLRERFVYLLRKHRPYAVLSFDPFGLYEGNLDHTRVAQAVEEAYWVARFDLHHPEHFDQGLEPHAVCEQWYFARQLPEVNHVELLALDHIQKKVEALAAHRTMVRNILNMHRLQLRTWGRTCELLDACFDGDPRPLLAEIFQQRARRVGEEHGLGPYSFAEPFRLVRFGDWEELFQRHSTPVAELPAGVPRATLDRFMG